MIPVVRFKEGVRLQGPKPDDGMLAPGGVRILAHLDALSRVLGRDITVTSIWRDNSVGHKAGTAVDVSVRGLDEPQIRQMWTWLNLALGQQFFTVLFEVPPGHDLAVSDIAVINPAASAPHLHIQTKKGTRYPPLETASPATSPPTTPARASD